MYKFENDRPIYLQIVDDILTKVFREEIKLGDKLESVRDLAILYTVNPNTIQRALTELEDEGLIITQRTSGKFITEDEQTIKNLRNSLAHETLEKFLIDMDKLDISLEELIELIKSERKGK